LHVVGPTPSRTTWRPPRIQSGMTKSLQRFYGDVTFAFRKFIRKGLMKNCVLLCAGLLAIPPFSAHSQPATDGVTSVASKISEVTVYADRARVSRSATIALHAGTARFAFSKLPGWIDEG